MIRFLAPDGFGATTQDCSILTDSECYFTTLAGSILHASVEMGVPGSGPGPWWAQIGSEAMVVLLGTVGRN